MDVELNEKNETGKGGPNSKSEENNPDIHVQGRTKVKVLRNEIEIETGPGEARLEGLTRTDSKTVAQLKEQPKERV